MKKSGQPSLVSEGLLAIFFLGKMKIILYKDQIIPPDMDLRLHPRLFWPSIKSPNRPNGPIWSSSCDVRPYVSCILYVVPSGQFFFVSTDSTSHPRQPPPPWPATVAACKIYKKLNYLTFYFLFFEGNFIEIFNWLRK